jgi:hypothetical protein
MKARAGRLFNSLVIVYSAYIAMTSVGRHTMTKRLLVIVDSNSFQCMEACNKEHPDALTWHSC